MYFLPFKPGWLENVSELKHGQLSKALSARLGKIAVKNFRDFKTALKEGRLNFVPGRK